MINKFNIGDKVYYYCSQSENVHSFVIDVIMFVEPESQDELLYGDNHHSVRESQLTLKESEAIDMEIERLKKRKKEYDAS